MTGWMQARVGHDTDTDTGRLGDDALMWMTAWAVKNACRGLKLVRSGDLYHTQQTKRASDDEGDAG